ncbi:MAG: hypothetical protein ACOVP2_12750 [Armatimonadaceae bacterium]
MADSAFGSRTTRSTFHPAAHCHVAVFIGSASGASSGGMWLTGMNPPCRG